MSIHEFHSNLTCVQPKSRLLAALKKMSRVENATVLLRKSKNLEPWQTWADPDQPGALQATAVRV